MRKQERIETIEQFKSYYFPELQKRELASKKTNDAKYGSLIAYKVLDGIKADISKLAKKDK